MSFSAPNSRTHSTNIPLSIREERGKRKEYGAIPCTPQYVFMPKCLSTGTAVHLLTLSDGVVAVSHVSLSWYFVARLLQLGNRYPGNCK